jgi:hypothetical protein
MEGSNSIMWGARPGARGKTINALHPPKQPFVLRIVYRRAEMLIYVWVMHKSPS